MRSAAHASTSLAALAMCLPAATGAQHLGERPMLTVAAPAEPVSCEAFADSLSMQGLVTLTASRTVAAGPGEAAPGGAAPMLPEHCLVEGVINQREGFGGVEYGIGFQLRMPTEWNGRFLLQGGGGLNGMVRPAIGPVAAGDTPALARGFAVASHDSGHRGEVFDASFNADQRASLDFAESAVPVVTQTARMLTAMFYGREPHHSYMTGCSTGGREGMLASQRYPELFDGIVIGAPAMRPGHSNLAIEWAQVQLNRTLPASAEGPASFAPAEIAAIERELTRQCDVADGREDGIVANVAACRAFDVEPLVCQPGDSGECLSPERAEALGAIMAGPQDASGRPVYVPFPWDTGITWSGPGLPGFLPAGQPSPFGPASTARSMDVDARLHGLRWDAAGRLTDTAYWTNLSTYLGRGAKLMFFHGVSDPWFSAWDTWDYFQRAAEANGEAAWNDAARFYMVPGMGHCSGGDAYDSFDMLGPLVDWVEREEAPGPVTAHRTSGEEAAMPLCPHPSYAHYTGGDASTPSSYECRSPQG